MWSLPNIHDLNERAVREHKRRKGLPPSPRGKVCGSCDGKAKYMIPFFDIFGDAKTREIPKGYIPVCRECYDSGRWEEGMFDCADCNKTFVENYTWELYYRDTDRGRVCLECAFNQELDREDFWVYESDVKRLRQYLDEGLHHLAFNWIRDKAKHIIGVKTTYWEDRLIFQGNVELDSSSGGRLIGSTSSESSTEGGVREIVEHLEKVIANTKMRDFIGGQIYRNQMPEARCAMILDAAYQFSVSIGVYFERQYSGVHHAANS